MARVVDVGSVVLTSDLWGTQGSSNVSRAKTQRAPMSPKTKGRMRFGRRFLLALRVLTLVAAAGSLFCAIVIQSLGTGIIWIMRVGVSI